MLKELKENDIDNIMRLWKNEFTKSNKAVKNDVLVNIYTKTRNKFINNLNSTILYTEDGEIEGFISIDENNEICEILVKQNIRREGIGTILLDNIKKKHKNISAKVSIKNDVAVNFFHKNGFETVNEIIEENTNEKKYLLEWKEKEGKKVTLIYFDDSIDNKLISKDSKIKYKSLNIKQLLKSEKVHKLEINNIKTYIKIRKELENIIESKKILLYIDYNNYYSFLDDQIKEIIKIKKIEMQIVLCDPFTIEGSKKANVIEEIEKSYKDYKINKIDCSLDIEQDININQIFTKRNEIILKKIETIAENM